MNRTRKLKGSDVGQNRGCDPGQATSHEESETMHDETALPVDRFLPVFAEETDEAEAQPVEDRHDPKDEGEAPPEDAVAVTLDVVLRAQFSGIIPRLRRGDPFCLVVVPASADWCRPLAEAVDDAVKGSAGAAVFGVSGLVIARSEAATRPTARDDDAKRVLGRLSKGKPIVGISHSPETALPPVLLRAADLTLRLRPLSGRQLRHIVMRVTGENPGRIADDFAGSLSLEDIGTCVRPGGGGKAALRRLAAAREARSRTRSTAAPPLEMLAGYGEARAWGLRLVREVARCRAGEIDLADLPRGLLLSGPPGSGKSLYAQALARSAGLPIIATSAAAWLAAGHLGDAIKSMLGEFEAARALAPAILFIDEADALVDPAQDDRQGRSYWLSFRAALLAAIDGATSEPGLILLGACNHPHLVDGALRRAGRLDRHIVIVPPPPSELAAILRTLLGEELAGENLAPLGELAVGFFGADLARAVRDARAAARDAERPLELEDIRAAIAPAESRNLAHLRLVALHEAGHAVAAHLLGQEVEHVSLITTGDAEGRVTLRKPRRMSQGVIEASVVVGLAGRATDVILGAGPCAGASHDLLQATRILACGRLSWGLGGSLLAVAEDEVERLLVLDPTLRTEIARELAHLWERSLALVRRHAAAITALSEALVRERVVGRQRLAQILREAGDEEAIDEKASEIGVPYVSDARQS